MQHHSHALARAYERKHNSKAQTLRQIWGDGRNGHERNWRLRVVVEMVPPLYVGIDAACVYRTMIQAHIGQLSVGKLQMPFYKDCVVVPREKPYGFGALLKYQGPNGNYRCFLRMCDLHVSQAVWSLETDTNAYGL